MLLRWSMAPRNHYQPLPRQRGLDYFRLLSLNPGEPDDPIVCELRVLKLPENGSSELCVAYEAVSYAWGPQEPKHNIRVGAWKVLIRDNLWCFLHQIRHSTGHLTLWIDSLCIDQSSPGERAYQVGVMDRIFLGASKVIVWLGPGDDDSLEAMRLIQEVSEDDSRGCGRKKH